MKNFFYFASLLTLSLSGFSQEVTKDDAAKLQAEVDKLKAITTDTVKPWKIGGVVSVNGQQVSLTNVSWG